MTGALSFKTVHASVRPARVAVFVDKGDEDWQDTCLRVIEFFSEVWGGAYNLIVPTDGKTIDERFWTILDAFDPDHLYAYRKSGEDIRLCKPEQYKRTLDAHISSWLKQSGQENHENAEHIKEHIDKDLRQSCASDFALTPELQNEIKVRLSPFYFQEWIVEAAAISAGSGVSFPLASLAKIILNTAHSDRFATINVPAGSVPKLWFSATCGAFSEETSKEFQALGIHQDKFEFEEDDIGQLIEFVLTGEIQRPLALPSNKRFFTQLPGIAPFQLSMLELGLYRPTKYQYWNEPFVLVAGNTVEDFCLYYCLSRLRDRVAWLLPSITEKALNPSSPEISSPERKFVSLLHMEEYSQRSKGGLACTSYSLTTDQIEAVIGQLNSTLFGKFRSEIRKAGDVAQLVQAPLVAVERDNFQRDIVIQFLDNDVSISPFSTPKPKNFNTIHPYEHRYITQLSVAQEAPPKHFDLGSRVIIGHAMTTKEVRIGKSGPAYFCPSVAYFGGDIDTVLVRPHLRLPPLHRIVAELAQTQGYECRPSDKGIYADETITKWGGLEQVARFLRDNAKRSLLDSFLDKSKSEVGSGVYLEDDRRRYLDFPAISSHVGGSTVGLIDELISKQILYRGFIFRCSYCRNSTWFSVSEVTQEFKCRRCNRSQIYAKANWKMPDEPAWFYKLDELIYQGYRQGMAVPLLALDFLRQKSSENFSFTTDREFWKPKASKPDAEIDLFCVADGVLTIGEAKKEDRLGKGVSDENAEITKYKCMTAGLAAQQLVLATFSDAWNTHTKERVISAFSDMPYVTIRFLTGPDLFS